MTESEKQTVLPGVDSPTPSKAPAESNGAESFALTLVALSEIEGVGQVSVEQIFDAVPNLSTIWNTPKEDLGVILRKARIRNVDKITTAVIDQRDELRASATRKLEDLTRRNVTVLHRDDLPERLRTMKGSPRWLFVEGDPAALSLRPSVAVVGTRTPSPRGIEATDKLIRILSAYPFALVSGLADGIDGNAHYYSLFEQMKNIAFLGHGVDLTFPAGTARLRRQIVESGGAVATEYLPNEGYQKRYFVQRNRLQAALSDLVIPVEGKAKSGTAHTLRFATEFGTRVIGLEWESAPDLVTEIQKQGYQTFGIFNASERRRLDSYLQGIVGEVEGAEVNPLSRAKGFLLAEMKVRDVTDKHLDRLIRDIEALRSQETDS